MATENWHLDRKVPIALILTIFMQTASAIWWAASISARLNNLEENQIAAKERAGQVETVVSDQSQKTAVLAEAVSNTNRNLERLQDELVNTNTMLREIMLGSREK